MARLLAFLIILILFINCKQNPNDNKSITNQVTLNLVENFEKDLNTLDSKEINVLDQATKLFQDYVSKTDDLNKKDSLFQPYFNFYNLVGNVLINESDQTISKYGFIKVLENNKKYLLPTTSKYLETNIIHHLSKPMQKFCNQQLKEFTDNGNLATIASNTLWWEKFNKGNPNFFLREMTLYHFKNWHLKNLLSGTNTSIIFSEEGKLLEDANKQFLGILAIHPETETSKIISEYLSLLKNNNMIKTDEVKEFLERKFD